MEERRPREAPQARPRDRLAFERGRRLLSRGSSWKPSVWLWEGEEGTCVVKDLEDLPGWGRPLAAWLLRRELRSLERAAGVEGVPRVLGRLDRRAVCLERRPGRPLDREAFQERPREHAEALRRAVAALHARGVFHLDLRQRQNLLVDEEGGLSLVDFGAAWAPSLPLRLLLGPVLAWVDRQAVLKYLARYAPGEMRPEEARALLRGLRWRRLWLFSPHRARGEAEAARRQLQDQDRASSTDRE